MKKLLIKKSIISSILLGIIFVLAFVESGIYKLLLGTIIMLFVAALLFLILVINYIVECIKEVKNNGY
nr:MAG TPA: hypothetical protein [Bacteriophage sp.]